MLLALRLNVNSHFVPGGTCDGAFCPDWMSNSSSTQLLLQSLLCCLASSSRFDSRLASHLLSAKTLRIKIELTQVVQVPIHCFWFYLITQVLKKALGAGNTVQGDVRSDSESDSDDEATKKER